MPRPPSQQDRLTRRLCDEPFLVPGRLARVLAAEVAVCERILGINPRSLRPADKGRIDELDRVVEAHLRSIGRLELLGDWKGPSARLRDICDYGVSGRVETIAAMMLAGAALARTDIQPRQLRADLAPALIDACERLRETPPPPKPHPLAQAYRALRLDSTHSLLAARMRTLLTDATAAPRLRLGRALSSLDPAVIEQHRARHFAQRQRHAAAGRRQGQLLNDASLSRPALSAPDRVELELTQATCDQQQDSTGSDAIFWLGHFCRVRNLPALYQQIDEAIRSGSFAEVTLDVQAETLVRQSPLMTFRSGDSKAVGMRLGEVDLVQGFGPWHCQVVCYEDDNQEYVAVQEVIDRVGDYAGYVSQGAQVVAAVSGPTVVAAGAAVVSTVASYVQLAAEVTSAVVGLVNLLDENDHIGSSRCAGQGDYLRVAAGDLPLPEHDLGLYRQTLTEKRIGTESVSRNWEVKLIHGRGATVTSSAGVVAGLSEDCTFSFKLPEAADRLTLWGIDHECTDEGWDGDRGWWRWVTQPVLSANDHLTVVGEFHVGQAGYGTVEDTPWAQGIRLLEPPL